MCGLFSLYAGSRLRRPAGPYLINPLLVFDVVGLSEDNHFSTNEATTAKFKGRRSTPQMLSLFDVSQGVLGKIKKGSPFAVQQVAQSPFPLGSPLMQGGEVKVFTRGRFKVTRRQLKNGLVSPRARNVICQNAKPKIRLSLKRA